MGSSLKSTDNTLTDLHLTSPLPIKARLCALPQVTSNKRNVSLFLLHLPIVNNGAFASEPFIQLWCMIGARRIDTMLDDLNGMALRFPLRYRAPALIFVCQQWHAISSRDAGTKTQVLILSALMVLMARRMSQTACHWKCNAAYGITSWNDSRNMMLNEISWCTMVSTGESETGLQLNKSLSRIWGGLSLFTETWINSMCCAWQSNLSISASHVCVHIHNQLLSTEWKHSKKV